MNKVYQLFRITSLMTGLTRHKHTIKETNFIKLFSLDLATFREVNLFSFCPSCLFYFFVLACIFSCFILGFLWHLYFFLGFFLVLSLSRLPSSFTLASFSTSHPAELQSSIFAFWQAKPSLILFLTSLSFLASSFSFNWNFVLVSGFFFQLKEGHFTLVKAGKHSLDYCLVLTLIFAFSFISRTESSAEPSSPFYHRESSSLLGLTLSFILAWGFCIVSIRVWWGEYGTHPAFFLGNLSLGSTSVNTRFEKICYVTLLLFPCSSKLGLSAFHPTLLTD